MYTIGVDLMNLNKEVVMHMFALAVDAKILNAFINHTLDLIFLQSTALIQFVK